MRHAHAAWAFVLMLLPLSLAAAEPVRIAGSAGLGDAPTKVAQGLGLFAATPSGEAALHAEFAASGKQALERLLRGEVHFALAAPTPVACAILEAADGDAAHRPVVLASVSLTTRAHTVLALRSRGFHDPGQLAGRRVGVMFDSSAHFGWTRFAEFHGIAQDAVTLLDIPIDRQHDALINGEVDAIVSWEPFASRIRAALGEDAVSFSTRRLYSLDWLLVARHTLVHEQPQLAARVLAAYLQALQFMQREPQAARAMYAPASGLAPRALATAERDVIFRLTLDWAVVANLGARIEWLRGLEAKPAPAPHPRDYLAPGPLLQVSPASVGLPRSLLSPTRSMR